MKFNKKIKVVILDFDGTILNNFNKSVKKHQETARRLNLNVPRKSEFRKMWLKGLPWKKLVKTLWPSDAKLFSQEYRKNYQKFKYKPVPGILKTLNQLREKCLLIIVTSRSKEHFDKRINDAKINKNIFFAIQLLEDSPFQKPDHRIYNRILGRLKRLKIKKQNVICVGDTLTDYKAAEGACLHFVGVLTGAATKSDFLKAGLSPRDIIQSVNDLPEYLTLFL